MSIFATSNTDVATITADNIQAGFSACSDDPTNAMPMTTSYVNAAFKWVCDQIETVRVVAENALTIANAITASNEGGGSALFMQRAGNTLQFRTLVSEKGVSLATVGDTVVVSQTIMCCYSELGFGGGAPSNIFAGSILVDDVTDPSNPITYIWSCAGNVYITLTSGVITPTTFPVGNGFTAIDAVNCIGVATGTFDNTTPAFTYVLTTSANLQVDAFTVNGVAAVAGGFNVGAGEVVSVDVSGVDPNAGNLTGSITMTYDDGVDAGTVVNIPVQLDCFVAPPAPTVPQATATIDCANMPVVIAGFVGATSLTVTSNIGANTAYTATPNGTFTDLTINGTGGDETLTIVASNGTVADDATMTVTVTGCVETFEVTCTTPTGSSVSTEDFVGDIQVWTTHPFGCCDVAQTPQTFSGEVFDRVLDINTGTQAQVTIQINEFGQVVNSAPPFDRVYNGAAQINVTGQQVIMTPSGTPVSWKITGPAAVAGQPQTFYGGAGNGIDTTGSTFYSIQSNTADDIEYATTCSVTFTYADGFTLTKTIEMQVRLVDDGGLD